MNRLPKYIVAVLKVNPKNDIISIEDITEGDYEEVVRCKDCIHSGSSLRTKDGVYKYCNIWKQYKKANWYCADGERGEE